MSPFIIIAAVVFGLVIGSFLGVCIYRIPLGRADCRPAEAVDGPQRDAVAGSADAPPASEITIASPSRSFCPRCKRQLLWWHNIPVVSWLLLRGRCSWCADPISVRYPVVELLSALAALGAVIQFGVTPTMFVVYAFVCSLIVLSFIDYDYYILPNTITLPGTAIGVAIGVIQEFTGIFSAPVTSGLWDTGLGLLFGGGFLWIVAEAYFRLRKIEGLGMGDVKLLAMTGALFGIECAFYTIFVGSILGSVVGIILMLVLRRGTQHPIPFGPYLAAATALYLYAPQLLISFWRGIIELLVGRVG